MIHPGRSCLHGKLKESSVFSEAGCFGSSTLARRLCQGSAPNRSLTCLWWSLTPLRKLPTYQPWNRKAMCSARLARAPNVQGAGHGDLTSMCSRVVARRSTAYCSSGTGCVVMQLIATCAQGPRSPWPNKEWGDIQDYTDAETVLIEEILGRARSSRN